MMTDTDSIGQTQSSFECNLVRLKLTFIRKKTKKTLFEPPFGGFLGNVRTPSIARWKACGLLPIRFS